MDVSKARLEGLEGYVEIDRDSGKENWRIVVSATASSNRQRFTISHELGHVLLMRAASHGYTPHLRRYRCAEQSSSVGPDAAEEALCNAFAEEFLMPTDDFSAQLAGSVVTPELILSLTSRYRVQYVLSLGKPIASSGKNGSSHARYGTSKRNGLYLFGGWDSRPGADKNLQKWKGTQRPGRIVLTSGIV